MSLSRSRLSYGPCRRSSSSSFEERASPSFDDEEIKRLSLFFQRPYHYVRSPCLYSYINRILFFLCYRYERVIACVYASLNAFIMALSSSKDDLSVPPVRIITRVIEQNYSDIFFSEISLQIAFLFFVICLFVRYYKIYLKIAKNKIFKDQHEVALYILFVLVVTTYIDTYM